LSKTLGEEQNSDSLLTQIARESMSESLTGATKAPKRGRSPSVVEPDELSEV
jgi:hypothetical protein